MLAMLLNVNVHFVTNLEHNMDVVYVMKDNNFNVQSHFYNYVDVLYN
jgi:hypothetical protein